MKRKEKTFKDMVKDVMKFHDVYGQPYSTQVTLIEEERYKMRHRLQQEENNEYLKACEEQDIVEIAHEIADEFYVLVGKVISHGLQDKIMDVFDEIQRANMSKLGIDGKPIYREDGKVLKGPNYTPPDVKKIFKKE